MTKKEIKLLVMSSYDHETLDEKKVEKISSLLSRKDLKAYLRGVKLEEKKHTITVALPSASVYNTTRKIFLDVFPGKTISIQEDKLLLLGARILADDTLFDFTLKKRLEEFLDDVEASYDEE